MKVEEWDPHTAGDDELREVYAFAVALADELDPETPRDPYELWRANLLLTSPFEETKYWVARTGDRIVGRARLELSRTDDNRHRANFDVEVAADQRRRGIGRELLARVLDAAEADGRTTLTAGAPQGSAGEQFLAAVGCEHAFVDRRSRLRVSDVDASMLERWIADAARKAPEYSLMVFGGRIPDEHVEAVIEVHTAMNDAPREGLDLEDERSTVEQLRDRERRRAEEGLVLRQLIVRHDPTGDFAGFSTVAWHPLLPQVVWQWGTAVTREHRGHALGRWLKAANFQGLLADNPAAEFIDTWNAGSNQWMLAINDAMGFAPYIWYPAYQGSTEAIRKAIA
ncbi:MAG TPA: GNAT family N-acetyltransferase [Acidimicrobiales bacterium]|nr:GNAT family N-acetyltransferase [Acidimicrobiales bacterium]